MPMTKRNIGIAKEVLNGGTVRDVAKKYSLHHSTVHEILQSFVGRNFLDHMKYDSSGNIKDLKGLRLSWREMLEG